MRFITKHQDIVYVLRASERVVIGSHQRNSKPIRAHFKGIGQGEFDTDRAARRFNWSEDEKRFAEEALLMHSDFNAVGGFILEPGQDLPDWALELVPAETAYQVMEAAKGACQFVTILENEGKAEACPMGAMSDDVPYCLKHALESGYEIEVTKKPDSESVDDTEDKKAALKRNLSRQAKEAATA